jgi:hypothetical protein
MSSLVQAVRQKANEPPTEIFKIGTASSLPNRSRGCLVWIAQEAQGRAARAAADPTGRQGDFWTLIGGNPEGAGERSSVAAARRAAYRPQSPPGDQPTRGLTPARQLIPGFVGHPQLRFAGLIRTGVGIDMHRRIMAAFRCPHFTRVSCVSAASYSCATGTPAPRYSSGRE